MRNSGSLTSETLLAGSMAIMKSLTWMVLWRWVNLSTGMILLLERLLLFDRLQREEMRKPLDKLRCRRKGRMSQSRSSIRSVEGLTLLP
jgi:hypothetical protein